MTTSALQQNLAAAFRENMLQALRDPHVIAARVHDCQIAIQHSLMVSLHRNLGFLVSHSSFDKPARIQSANGWSV